MIQDQVSGNKVMLYMKGTPAQPQCGFSQQVCRILHATGVEFSSVNVLEDEALREGIKEFSDWPTIPQLYVGGECVAPRRVVSFLEIARERVRPAAAGSSAAATSSPRPSSPASSTRPSSPPAPNRPPPPRPREAVVPPASARPRVVAG